MKLFGGVDNPSSWQDLSDMDQLDGLFNTSQQRNVAIFKHSTRCGVSRVVKNDIAKNWDASVEIEFHYLDLLAHRDISNAIADRTGILHESPQLIVLRNGMVKYHASHHSIGLASMNEALNTA